MLFQPKQLDLFQNDKEELYNQIDDLVLELRIKNRLCTEHSFIEDRVRRSRIRDDLIEKLRALQI